MHDPRAYVTPDVVVDISEATISELAPDRVRVEGVAGRERPAQLKVSVGHSDGCVGEGQISYAGPGAVARGRLALEVVAERLRITGVKHDELRLDLIGVDALHGDALSRRAARAVRGAGARGGALREPVRCAPHRRRGRDAVHQRTRGGGGVCKSTREIIGVTSTFVPRDEVHAAIEWEVA